MTMANSDSARVRRVADRIKQLVAGMLERRIKDPRLGFVTVTDVRLTADLRDATVYYTVYGSERERADTAAALESAKGVLRSEMGRRLEVRHTPSLTFVADRVPETARHIETLVEQARQADAEVDRAAQGARYAGDADPYRRSGEDVDEDEFDAEHGQVRSGSDV